VPFTDYFINHPDTKAMPHLLWERSVFTDAYRQQLVKIRSGFSDNASLTALDYFIGAQTHGLTRPSYISPQDEFHFLEIRINSRTHYIDGGAFDGDTVERFLDLAKTSFRKITAVEPDPLNINKLKTVISVLPGTIKQKIEILPAAIAPFSGQAQFQANGNTASCLSPTGQTYVSTIGLKDLIDEPDLLIKLDIEGSEESSVTNALPEIRKYLPVLAISVYHHSKDMIRIFEILKNEVPDYQYAFRILGNNATDAMLYCYPKSS
jgi:FkbM family methyltransferase